VRDHTPWLKLIGGVWLGLGILALLWGGFAILPASPADLVPFHLAPAAKVFWQQFQISPWIESIAIFGGIFGVTLGWCLIRRQSWAQTVLVSAHMLLAVYGVIGWMAAFVLRSRPDVWWAGGPVIFFLFVLVNGGLAFFFGSVGTTEALSWLPLRTLPIIPLRCEFCGTPLDPKTKLCPQCDVVPEIVDQHMADAPPSARLVNLSDQTEFWIEPQKPIFIGRGLTGNEINLDNPTVSRHHAQIEFKEGHFVLTALQDSNGTFINDTLVRQRALRDGDEVRFGRARFQFEIVEGQEGQVRYA
jgi:hypothetical protein